MKKLFLVTAICVFMAQVKASAIPSQITYQGTLKESGVPVNTTKNMTFLLVSSDGRTPYSNIIPAQVPIVNGLFSVPLDFQLIPPYTWDTINPYIQVSVEGQAFGPIEPVTATIYAVISSSVVDNAITTSKLADTAVATAKLADMSVTTGKLADTAVTTAKLSNASVTTAQLADMSVTSTIIADGAVTTSKLANGSVNTAQLADMSVTSTAIADGAVTPQKLSASIGTVPTGTILPFAGSSAPAGYFVCDGSAIDRGAYNALFLVIGTVWGGGNGVSTFNLPDLRGKTPIGSGQGVVSNVVQGVVQTVTLTNRNLADSGGEEMHTLTISEMPAHSHGLTANVTASLTNGGGGGLPTGAGSAIVTSSSGGGMSHNNMQPYLVVNYIIKI